VSVEPPALPPAPPLSRRDVREALAGQVLLAPLTRGGNLPFRRLCVELGASWTFSEMAMARHVVRGSRRELALLRRHESEPFFGVQLAARSPDLAVAAARVAVLRGARVLDLNLGCPVDSVVRRGEGAALLQKPRRVEALLRALREAVEVPLFVKIRTGYADGKENAVTVARIAEDCGVDAITVHGRTREQRYRRAADWDRIAEVAGAVGVPVIGNGDILHAHEARHRLATSGCAAVMVARGALIKPWLFADIAAGEDRPCGAEERLALMRRWVELALDTWRADEIGFLRTRELLEFHVDWWSRHVPPDAETSGAVALQHRTAFTPRDELEAILAAPGDEGVDRCCRLVLEPFDPPPSALQPTANRDATAGGWA
jgi:tRNA-dihydrouridine synthase 3